jgi:hypothetical protein
MEEERLGGGGVEKSQKTKLGPTMSGKRTFSQKYQIEKIREIKCSLFAK